MEENNINNTEDGKTKVILYAKDGNIWMNQNQWLNFLTPPGQILVCIYLKY